MTEIVKINHTTDSMIVRTPHMANNTTAKTHHMASNNTIDKTRRMANHTTDKINITNTINTTTKLSRHMGVKTKASMETKDHRMAIATIMIVINSMETIAISMVITAINKATVINIM
ncbi:hypothetical protein BDFB_006501 [Asbolus verrucosus]|uniref:Uncharacterized protein n=1 Tax=Asbolus verrucosus TaxID=1661398 RepID=A0A482W4W8_ASBVE|nr:hypothetical protein BDFB_006501 [Asbolus verrucosus]